ncbi:ferritin family protein [Hydrogenimonas sp. SS33]|uniref:ferritin family protein n=1 Tax=Hydrogenimonas leucolamina TaxID=2954236 RepID=UPI00336BF0B3
MQKRLFTTIHEGWLKLLFSSFSAEDREWGETLYDYSEILYRHLRFVENLYVQKGLEYSYERPGIQLTFTTEGEAARFCDEVLERIEVQLSDNGDPLAARMLHDLAYIRGVLQKNFDRTAKITAFDRSMTIDGVAFKEEALAALMLFLFEESYKEYELIVVYSYAQTQVEDKRLAEIFQVLIDESKFHLKSFARMMAKMGILAVPRMVTQEIYRFSDLKKFLEEGIEEEKGAKEQCRALAEAVENDDFQKFFTFINYQEDYHITLMEEALKRLADHG